jgi:hypothetical protein
LHIDKLLPQAEIRCLQPYTGLLTVDLKQACKVRVRIPDFVDAKAIRAKSNRGEVKARAWGNYLELGDRQAGEKLEVTYPVPIWDEQIAIGNPGFRQYRYRVTWKGDTVVRMMPIGVQTNTGFSDFDGRPVEIYYGKDGPGPLYRGIPCWKAENRNLRRCTWMTAHWISGCCGRRGWEGSLKYASWQSEAPAPYQEHSPSHHER